MSVLKISLKTFKNYLFIALLIARFPNEFKDTPFEVIISKGNTGGHEVIKQNFYLGFWS